MAFAIRIASLWLIVLCVSAWLPARLSAAEPSTKPTDAAPNFATDVTPFLRTYCADCHGDTDPESGLDLTRYSDSGNIQTEFETWEKVLRMLTEREMPPKDADQPTEAELATAVRGIEAELAKFDCGSQRHPGRVTIRRLNRGEYNNTIRDLVGIDFQPAADFPADDVGNGFDNIADVLSIPPLLVEKYLAAAQSIVEGAMADEVVRQRLLKHNESGTAFRGQAARQNLHDLASRAFRRKVTEAEVERLYDLVRLAREQGASDSEAFQAALMAVLASPHFLFRIESDPAADDEDGIRELGDYELASRLSYFLWSSMPDEELFRLAREDKLHEPEMLRQQVRRMLHDPKARALTKNFAGQWLQLRSVADMSPDPALFPDFDQELRSAMLRETEMFFEAIVAEDRSVLDFLTADYTFVNERLAKHYGMEGVQGKEFRRVRLDSRRRGVLTQGSILLLTSNPTRTSPVKRGKWVLDNILDEPPSDPPPGIEPLDENAELLGSLRERLEQHRADASCAVCHRKMDPLGFGFENFDATGAWRERDGKFEIDVSGSLPGGLEFSSASELVEILAKHKRHNFCRCLAEKMLTYALGRGLESFDRCSVDEIVEQLEENDYRFSELVISIVLSDPFRLRQAKEAN